MTGLRLRCTVWGMSRLEPPPFDWERAAIVCGVIAVPGVIVIGIEDLWVVWQAWAALAVWSVLPLVALSSDQVRGVWARRAWNAALAGLLLVGVGLVAAL